MREFSSAPSLRPRTPKAVLLICLGLAFGLASGPGAGPAVAQEPVIVIVHPTVPVSGLTRQEVSDLFLKKTKLWSDRTPVVPVDLAEGTATRSRFSTAFHKRDVAAIEAYWQKLIFSGREVPPTKRASAAEVVSFVRRQRGAVGYVPAGTALGPEVKVLKVMP